MSETIEIHEDVLAICYLTIKPQSAVVDIDKCLANQHARSYVYQEIQTVTRATLHSEIIT